MIAFINGEVIARRDDCVVVQTSGGVGYQLAVSAETLSQVGEVGETTALHCHLVARDDSFALFGFASEEERELFLMLLGVQGVGPKVALALLSGGPPRELANALASGDVARLQAVPGIGKRTAERILVELREKVIGLGGEQNEITVTRGDDPRRIARDGLVELGFTMQEADTFVSGAQGDSAEDLLQSALKAARQ
jgi:Holliday junction DNA helicase RuvA